MPAPTVTVTVPVIDPQQNPVAGHVRFWPANGPNLRTIDGAVVTLKVETFPLVDGTVDVPVPESDYYDPPTEWVLATPGPNGGLWSGLMPHLPSGTNLETLVSLYGWGAVEQPGRPPIQTVIGMPGGLILGQTVFPGFDNTTDTVVTVFNADGSITESYTKSGLVVTTVFNPDGSITETYVGPLMNHVKTTSFAASGAITETVT